MRKNGMLGTRRKGESGIILLNIIALLIIILAVVGSLFSMQPLEVLSQKQERARREVEMLAEAMKRYAEDLISANYYDVVVGGVGSGSARYRCQFCPTVALKLGSLARKPDPGPTLCERGSSGLGILPDSDFWKGPYIPVDQNQSAQLGMTFSADGQPLDPWGNPYQFSLVDTDSNPSTWDNIFSISCVSPQANGAIAATVDMLPVYTRVTEERVAVLESALKSYLQSKSGNFTTLFNSMPGNLLNPTAALGQEAANAGLYFPLLVNDGKLPNSKTFISDGYGTELLSYSDTGSTIFSPPPTGFIPNDDFAPLPYIVKKVNHPSARIMIVPTNFQSGILTSDDPPPSSTVE